MAVFVFDLGGTLMEYANMPPTWSVFYPDGFRAVADAFYPACSTADLQESVARLTALNPRVTGREQEYPPAKIFSLCLSHWKISIDPEAAAVVFFQGLHLQPKIDPLAVPTLRRLKALGHKTAVLTDLPSGMPDALFRRDIAPLLPHIDRYVSSGTCGYRKPNPAGLLQIAACFSVDPHTLVFIGDEDKDHQTAMRAGCRFFRILPDGQNPERRLPDVIHAAILGI